MAHFPLFIDLTGRRCVVVGGGAVAARKAQALADFGAVVAVIAPRMSAAMLLLARSRSVALIERAYQGRQDIEGAVMVLAATNDGAVNERVSRDAQEAGIPVNVADAPQLCTFFFPAIVRRGELVAGLTSSGQCPALTSQLREQLDNAWPPELEGALPALAQARKRIIVQTKDAGERTLQLKKLASAMLDKVSLIQEPGQAVDKP